VQFALTVPSFEDKVAQRAVAMVLEVVYEQDFLSCSYGFRPGRSAHQAWSQLSGAMRVHRQRWVVELMYASTWIVFHTTPLFLRLGCRGWGCEQLSLKRRPFLRPRLIWMASLSCA
jgi:retron-type reverse transcriptase